MKHPLALPRAASAFVALVVATITTAVFIPDAQSAPNKRNHLTRLQSMIRVEMPKPEENAASKRVTRPSLKATTSIENQGYRVSPSSARQESKSPRKSLAGLNRGSLTVRTTAYTHTESDHVAYANKNAIGTTLQYGSVRSAAADWSVYPLGTRFQIEGDPTTYVIDDYGSALVGTQTIDLYKPSTHSMNQWGVRHVKIRVVQWGSYQKSLDILKDRSGYWHVRAMVRELLAKTSLAAAY